MATKIVFFLALVALVYGLPASESNLESTSDVAAVNEVPASLSLRFEKLYAETPTYIVLENKPTEVEEGARRVRRSPRRQVCRRVMVRKNGKNYPRWQCL